jgi:signal transduction histidine kinase/ActR/RegA family two-component response regulator
VKRDWRLFRHDAGRVSGPAPWVYVVLFAVCMAVGYWSTEQYGAIVIWPANGVILAALLQLRRRPAITVLVLCFGINLIGNYLRGDSAMGIALNPLLNFGEVTIAALLARRLCGAALDMRRPLRLARFAFFAAIPATAIAACIGVAISQPPPELALSVLLAWFSVDLLGLLVVTPALMLIARGHRFRDLLNAPLWEQVAWPALVAAVTLLVFIQPTAPIVFLIFPPLLIVSFRLPPGFVGLSVILVAAISAGATLTGAGPIANSVVGERVWAPALLSPGLQVIPVFYLFMGSVLCVALPVSTALTERRRLVLRLKARTHAAVEARLKAEDAAQARSRFLAMMSHEMRTPLNGVTGYATLLATRRGLDDEARRQADQIRLASEGLLRIVDDILDFSRGVIDLAHEPFSPAAVMEAAVERARPAAERAGLTVRIIDPVAPHIRHCGDARRIGQVLTHLLGNAVKFSDAGVITVTAMADAYNITLFVSDQGRGLSGIDPQALFQPFAQGDTSTTRAVGGAGMGLAVCRKLTDAMGGEIGAGDGPGGGARFWFRVPAPRVADAAPIRSATPEPVVALKPEPLPLDRAPRVLVVDDHPVNREVAGLMLTAAGCEVSYAVDGVDAVDKGREGGLDLIFMDVRMPRMDGLAATRALRALETAESRTPIVAMTADAMPEDVARCLEAGMDEHLAKPISQAALVAAVGRAMDKGRTVLAPAI